MVCKMASLPEADMKKVTWTSDVYEPSDDSFALVDAVKEYLISLLAETPAIQRLPGICLEVGCGSGYIICSVALALQQVHKHLVSSARQAPVDAENSSMAASPQAPTVATPYSFCATDINPAALEATAATLAAHAVTGVELVQTDLVEALMPRLSGRVDLLLFNPPYVPTPDEEVLRPGIARAWAGGHLGRRVTDRLLAQLPDLLSPTGHAFIVTVPENKPQDIIAILQDQGLTASIVLTRSADEESLQILHVQRPVKAAVQ